MATLKGVFPDPKPIRKKNYLQENLKSLRKLEQENQHKKNGNLEDEKQRRFGSRMSLSLEGRSRFQPVNRKTSAPAGLKSSNSKIQPAKLVRSQTGGDLVLKQGKSMKMDVSKSTNNLDMEIVGEVGRIELGESKSRDFGIQTLDVKDEEELYLEGTIRYPSSRVEAAKELEPDKNNQSKPGETKEMEKDKDFVKMNKEKLSVASRLAHQLMNGAVPPNYRKGVVPKYILERKEELQQKAEKEKAEAEDPCPGGHIPLPDNERKETLRLLKKKHQDYVGELNKLPIKSDTLRCQTRKIDIEKQLNKLEDGIKIFSRPKVFVKIDA